MVCSSNKYETKYETAAEELVVLSLHIEFGQRTFCDGT